MCLECGNTAITKLRDVVNTGDSDEYPQGPYADGGGEADCPQHCDACGVFLENPLTDEGIDYVTQTVLADQRAGKKWSAALDCWAEFYGISINEEKQDNA